MSQPHAYPAPPPPTPAPKRAWWRRARVLAPVAFLAGIAIGAGGKGTPATDAGPATTGSAVTATETKTATKTATAAAKPAPKPVPAAAAASMPDDGTYLVGPDIAPGTYRAPGGDACYWARLKDTDGDLSSVLANGLGGGRKVVTIARTDKAFETRGCGAWTRL
jgi:hypothetical protein